MTKYCGILITPYCRVYQTLLQNRCKITTDFSIYNYIIVTVRRMSLFFVAICHLICTQQFYLYIYRYIYIYICMYINIYIYIYMYVYICILSIYIYTCV